MYTNFIVFLAIVVAVLVGMPIYSFVNRRIERRKLNHKP